MSLKSNCLLFNEISSLQLYQCLKLRADVFVVEQQCVYADLDNKDIHSEAHHVLFYDQDDEQQVIAYARCLPPKISYSGSSIGRVVVHNRHRGSGVAQLLMNKAIAVCCEQWPSKAIEIGAQYHLLSFYENFGFVATGSPYDEDGILHIDMKRTS